MGAMEQLQGLAQIAATYSGFIAVFIAFVNKDGRFSADDAHFVQAMVLGTIGTIILALAPPVLGLMMPRQQVWFSVTVFAVVGGVPAALYQAWTQRRIDKADVRQVHVAWHVPGWALGFCALACFVVALLKPELREGMYVAGVTLSLTISIWCFIAITFRKFF
jgi:hypothetical protein